MESLYNSVIDGFSSFRGSLIEFQLTDSLKNLLPPKTSLWFPLDEQKRNIAIVGTGILGLYLSTKAYGAFKKSQQRKKWASAGKDVVILHQFGRGRNTPSASPFILKLETYLRMAKIPYECDFQSPMGPKGKSPWITLNGEEFGDSQLCIELLNRKFNKDLNSHLTAEQRAVATAFRVMTEEHLYWIGLMYRWVYSKGRNLDQVQADLSIVVRLMAPFISKRMKAVAFGQGIGRHSQTEVEEMGLKALRAFSAFLGSKPFFMGDKATEVDCAIFGMLAQILWNGMDRKHSLTLHSDLINLKDYCQRMKETYWPDWDRCLNPVRV